MYLNGQFYIERSVINEKEASLGAFLDNSGLTFFSLKSTARGQDKVAAGSQHGEFDCHYNYGLWAHPCGSVLFRCTQHRFLLSGHVDLAKLAIASPDERLEWTFALVSNKEHTSRGDRASLSLGSYDGVMIGRMSKRDRGRHRRSKPVGKVCTGRAAPAERAKPIADITAYFRLNPRAPPTGTGEAAQSCASFTVTGQ
ncbi:hypothetical protein GOC33_30525 [Sinorhizobium meliloti]|nr:hypothetical protein [Sinorhizobium meliloti]